MACNVDNILLTSDYILSKLPTRFCETNHSYEYMNSAFETGICFYVARTQKKTCLSSNCLTMNMGNYISHKNNHRQLNVSILAQRQLNISIPN